jgi:PPM family protein phosphatase
MTQKIESYAISDVGQVRENNEDRWGAVLEKNFFALADGMGGHNAGEVAAKMIVESLCNSIKALPPPLLKENAIAEVTAHLASAIRTGSASIFKLSCEVESCRGMGTTLCCFLLVEKKLICAHIGDSRIYRYRNEKLEQLTQDHSLRSEMIASGLLEEGRSASFPYKNVITRAIGTSLSVQPEIKIASVEPGDIYFLCSDGLTDAVTPSEIRSTLSYSESIKEASDALVATANAKGGGDNITIVMIKISA